MAFKGQKMSSRLGGVPTAEEVLGAVQDEVQERSPDLSVEAREAIAVGALKFVILRSMAGKNINFDPDTSLSFEGDSGPYLQYTAVRAGSLLSKAQSMGITPKIISGENVTSVERLIARFPDIVERSITEWAPHHIVSYLLELAQAFNSWYGNTKIIDESDSQTSHRLAITQALMQTITNGLWLLGISVPKKM
jgi:arginyl-tRNA synthetase